MNIDELSKPLDPRHVASRQQGGAQVSYIEGWHAIAEANRIFGFDGWARETLDVRQVAQFERTIGQQKKPGWSVTYTAKVRITVGDVVREGTGAGHGIGTDLGECHESAIKEAETDAMKRALMTFGNPFGLALYDKSRANVQAPPPETISEEQRSELVLLLDSLNFPADRFLSVSKIKDLRDLPASKFEGAKGWIAAEAKKLENA